MTRSFTSVKPIKVQCHEVPEPPQATWTNAWRVGQELVISGLTAHPATQRAETQGQALSVYEQTLQVLGKLKALIEASGGHKYNVVKTVVYLTDMGYKQDVSRARADFFEGGPFPCSTLVGVNALAFPELRVEIDAWVRLDVDLRDA